MTIVIIVIIIIVVIAIVVVIIIIIIIGIVRLFVNRGLVVIALEHQPRRRS